jgi:MOSC domain-containing protein YiiM
MKPLSALTARGTVVEVSVSREKGVRKENIHRSTVLLDHGLEGDAHGGTWHRQVSLLAMESIQKMLSMGLDVSPGDFAENITTRDIDLCGLPVGTRLRVGEAVLLEVTQIGKQCHSGCAIFQKVGQCIMPKEGVFARVLRGGTVQVGDVIAATEEGSG